MSHLLYTLTQRCLDVLPVDAAGRRCCDETLADWRREAAAAKGSGAAFVVSVRAMFAVLRCVAGITLREVMLIRQSGVLTRVVLWTVAYLAIVTAIVQLSPDSSNILRPATFSRIYAQVALVASFFPIALIFATGLGGNRRAVPSLGIALVALLIGFPLLGWGAPIANRAFLDANPARWTYPDHPERGEEVRPWKPGDGLMMSMEWPYSAAPPRSPAPFGNDLTLGQLRGKVLNGPDRGGWAAVAWLSFFAAYLVTCVLAPVLASVLRRRAALVRYGVLLITAVILFRPYALAKLAGEFSVVMWLCAYWIPVAWMCLLIVATARRDPGLQATNNQ
jgi:hypothetical protein